MKRLSPPRTGRSARQFGQVVLRDNGKGFFITRTGGGYGDCVRCDGYCQERVCHSWRRLRQRTVFRATSCSTHAVAWGVQQSAIVPDRHGVSQARPQKAAGLST